MIHKIVVTNPKGEALELELANPDKSGFTVAKVEGLGPPKATINGQSMATSDGMVYSSARIDTRQIIFTLEFRGRTADNMYGPLTIEECRRLCYRYFPLKKEITVTVYTDGQILYTKGYVESNEPEIFSMQEYATISIICPDPYVYEVGTSTTIFSGVQATFEFPFSNESLTDHLIEFSRLWFNTMAILEYEGTIDTGVLITIHAFGTCSNIRLVNVNTKEEIVINTDKIFSITGKAFDKSDDIIISTVRGDRYCKLYRNGTYTNIIAALEESPDWFQISNGSNAFGFTADLGENNISVTFEYKNAYMGV